MQGVRQLQDNFEIISFDCAGIDGLIFKLHLKAKTIGQVLDSKLLGLPVLIKEQNRKKSALQTLFSAFSEPAETENI